MVCKNPLDLRNGREHGGHPAVVSHGDARHLAAAGADRFQCVVKGQRAGSDQRSVFAEAVAHRHVGPMP